MKKTILLCLACLAQTLAAAELTPAQKLEAKRVGQADWEVIAKSQAEQGLEWHEPKRVDGKYGGPTPGHWRPKEGLTPAQKHEIERDRGQLLQPLQKKLEELSEERENADEAGKKAIDRKIYSISVRLRSLRIPDVTYWEVFSELQGSSGFMWVEEQNMGRWVRLPTARRPIPNPPR